MEEFKNHKGTVPQPTVQHDNTDPFLNDIIIPNLTLVIGGKELLDEA